MELSSQSDNVIALNSFCTLEKVSVDPILEQFNEVEFSTKASKTEGTSKIQYHDSLEEMSLKIMGQVDNLKNTLKRSRYYLNELNLD